MKKMIGLALLLYTVTEMWSPDWWLAAKAELSKKIEQAKTK